MEFRLHKLSELFTRANPDGTKSISIYDQNYNNLCATGKLRVTESDATNIRMCISSSWRRTVRIQIGEYNYLCIVVGDVLLGKRTITCHERYAQSSNVKENSPEDIAENNVLLTATLVDGLTIILTGPAKTNESLLGLLKVFRDIVPQKT